jgi:hypothetical protein
VSGGAPIIDAMTRRAVGWTVVLSGPEHLDRLQAAATEAESLSTSIQAAGCLARVFYDVRNQAGG